MKHILSTITVLFILITSSVSWGVEKKGLICQCTLCSIYKLQRGYWFEGGKVHSRKFSQINDNFVTDENMGKLFSTTSEQIEWWDYFEYRINRQSLTLKTFLSGELKTQSKCDVFDEVEFEKTWKRIQDQHQNSFNKKLEKN